jgi:hypothetical protein
VLASEVDAEGGEEYAGTASLVLLLDKLIVSASALGDFYARTCPHGQWARVLEGVGKGEVSDRLEYGVLIITHCACGAQVVPLGGFAVAVLVASPNNDILCDVTTCVSSEAECRFWCVLLTSVLKTWCTGETRDCEIWTVKSSTGNNWASCVCNCVSLRHRCMAA